MKHYCGHVLEDGRTCRARVLAAGDRCGWHMPEVLALNARRAERERAARRAEHQRTLERWERDHDALGRDIIALRKKLAELEDADARVNVREEMRA